MQQPTSGVTLKSYVSGFNCCWMNGKASKLLPLPPASWNLKQASHPAVGRSADTTLTSTAAIVREGPERKSLPFPYRYTHRVTLTHARLSPPPRPVALLFWECDATDVSHTVGVFWNTHVPSHARKQTGMRTKPLVCRGQYWCKQAAMRSEENESSRIINGGDQPGDVAEVRWVKAGEAWRVTHNKCFVVASHSILLAVYTHISALNQSDLKGTVHSQKQCLFVSVREPSHEEARARDGVGC